MIQRLPVPTDAELIAAWRVAFDKAQLRPLAEAGIALRKRLEEYVALAATVAPDAPVFRHADGGLYVAIHAEGETEHRLKHPGTGEWLSAISYRSHDRSDGLVFTTTRDRWVERFERVGADEIEACFICAIPFKAGDMVLDDVCGGTGHRDCFGDDRQGFVRSLDTGEPLKPGDPLPTGYVWEPDPQ